MKAHNVLFAYNEYNKTKSEFLHFFEEYCIDLVYAHFYAYDMAISKASNHSQEISNKYGICMIN